MAAAQQVFSHPFDRAFFELPRSVQERIQARIDEIGLRLADYPHYHLTGSNRYRLRVGDYRVIYRFDVQRNAIELLNVGHRREVYRLHR
jgi:mRNA interferase RelE/StbE